MNLAPFSKAAVTVALAISTLAVTPAISANASPVLGENQSLRTTYYSDSAHTAVVGETYYGECGDNYAWGEDDTHYFTYTVITCG
jgi:hypothetical protein